MKNVQTVHVVEKAKRQNRQSTGAEIQFLQDRRQVSTERGGVQSVFDVVETKDETTSRQVRKGVRSQSADRLVRHVNAGQDAAEAVRELRHPVQTVASKFEQVFDTVARSTTAVECCDQRLTAAVGGRSFAVVGGHVVDDERYETNQSRVHSVNKETSGYTSPFDSRRRFLLAVWNQASI